MRAPGALLENISNRSLQQVQLDLRSGSRTGSGTVTRSNKIGNKIGYRTGSVSVPGLLWNHQPFQGRYRFDISSRTCVGLVSIPGSIWVCISPRTDVGSVLASASIWVRYRFLNRYGVGIGSRIDVDAVSFPEPVWVCDRFQDGYGSSISSMADMDSDIRHTSLNHGYCPNLMVWRSSPLMEG